MSMSNEKVYICFDGQGFDVVGVYNDKSQAYLHMISYYINYLKEQQKRAEEQGNNFIEVSDIIFDLESMQKGYIETIFYIEEHEVESFYDNKEN